MHAHHQPRRVTLELDNDPDAIHGTLEHHDGTRERFWGWLDLMAALERDSTQVQHVDPAPPAKPDKRQ